MSATLSPSERPPVEIAALQANRAVAALRLAAAVREGQTRLADLAEGGGYRIKFPHPARGLEAVLVNTGGGLLGGDRLALEVEAGEGADLMMTSQSAEKVYRAVEAAATIGLSLRVGAGGRLHWLPMETILFSGARLARRIEAEVAPEGELMIAEATVFGRIAMGETLGPGLLSDIWRIRRGGRLVYADSLRLGGALGPLLARPAVTNGASAMASLVLVSPRAESLVDEARALLSHEGVEAGVSAWNGLLVARLLAADPARLRPLFTSLTAALGGRATPRFW